MDFRCRDCGSERVAPNVSIFDGAPSGSPLLRIRARVCADCGAMELRAENALDLYFDHLKSLGRADAGEGVASEAGPGAATNLQCPHCGSVIHAASPRCDACGWIEER